MKTSPPLLFVLLLSLLVASLSYGQSFLSFVDGNWTTNSNWSGGTAPALGNPGGITTHNSHTITIGSDIVLNSGISIAGGTTIIVTAGNTLTINGSATFQNNSTILVEEGAILIINGNVTNNNNSNDITIDGTIIIDGNFTGGNGSEVVGSGDFEISGSVTTSGSGSVFGSTDNCTDDCSITQSTPLPISLSNFSVTINQKDVTVSWTTESERDNHFFEVLHSVNGLEWEVAGTIPGAGNSSTTVHYSFVHTSPVAGINYYKLSQQDFNGTREYFLPASISIDEKPHLIGRVNTLGQEVNENYQGLVIEYYSDGSTVKRIQ